MSALKRLPSRAAAVALAVFMCGPLSTAASDWLDPADYRLLPRPLFAQAEQPRPPVEPERPRPQKPQEQLLLERGAILLRQGTLQVEPSVDWSRFSTDRVAVSGLTVFEAILIGRISVDRLDRDIVTAALTTRYGILDRLQAEVRIPYVYRSDRELLGVGTADERERTVEGTGLGDIETTIAGQPFIGRDMLPDVLLRVRTRFPTGRNPFEVDRTTEAGGAVRLKDVPTGAGFFSVAPGFTLVWRTDPVVFFVGGSYFFNLERDFGREFGRVDPGDTVEVFAGLNLAVSDRVAVNVSFVDQITDETKVGGRRRTGTSFNDGRLILGTSVALRPNVALLLSVGAGLTREAPDFSVTFSLPISFKLF